MNSSTSSAWRASSGNGASTLSRIAAIRRKAATNSRASFARITPRLAESASGLRTHGNSTRSARAAGSLARPTSPKRGTGTPAAARQRRIACLSRAVATAGREFALRPRRWLMAAAATVVRSSTGTTASIGRRAAKRAIVSALPSGSAKSSVTSASGARCSSVLARSEAHTSSTPSLAAASTNASVRYVVVGRRSSNRAPDARTGVSRPRGAWALRFARRVVGVAPGGVIGRVEDFGDLGDLFLDQSLDPLLQRDVRGAAALAAAAHLKIDPVVLHVDELDKAAVAGNRGVDRGIEQLLNTGLQIVAHDAPLKSLLYPSLRSRANWPSVGSAQQNQGSVSRGGRVRRAAGGAIGRRATPALWSASSQTR